MFDAQLYRSKDEIESWRAKDPITRFATWLRATNMLHDVDQATMEQDVAAEVAASAAFAEAGTWEPLENLTRDVMTPRPAA
jgi:TPP-dependent pyruvate/acetoin dehydrogenase alpha subunit